MDTDEIAKVACDIFAPCALGGVIDDALIEGLQTTIICGAANNQLFDMEKGDKLHQKNILFVPDYVANAGGVICAAAQAGVISKEEAIQKVDHIYDSVTQIIHLSKESDVQPMMIANKLAEERFS